MLTRHEPHIATCLAALRGAAGGCTLVAWLSTLVVCLLCSSCYRQTGTLGSRTDGLTAELRDSLNFAYSHHYSVGYNFVMHGDSLLLLDERPLHTSEGAVAQSDSLWLEHADQLVVAAIIVIPEDSIDSVWVKVARDQLTMGWTHEGDLLRQASPDDPISQFIRIFSSRHTLWFFVVMGLTLLVVLARLTRRLHFRSLFHHDIPSAYPTFLTIALAAAAVLYAYIQHRSPQMWVHFYFHPTLNPLAQPPAMCAFLCSVWLLLLLAIATLQDVLRLLPLRDALLYLLFLLGFSMFVYLVFSLLPSSPLSCLLALAYACFAVVHYWRHSRAKYFCGNCGLKLHQKGRCPRCGAVND